MFKGVKCNKRVILVIPMGNICCFFCRPTRCKKCGVPFDYYKYDEHRERPSCRGSSYDVINDYDKINDYPGIERKTTYKNEYHIFK